ncbi:amidase signature enzyme [Corynespora cassiicola Philippines]|uniref:Amidase signature enzyme n=1 Tax=Corynespora cassiicola Philippines TaxID=1448308 RepID=A0A2T2NBF7_CORCC|nr:amidase signature enzyme [Corynespora cassiicola Philippines]
MGNSAPEAKQGPGSYTEYPFAGWLHKTLDIAVPSRLHWVGSSTPPLHGIRISIKDLYHLNGMQTSLCNSAYDDLYGTQHKSAEIIKRLIRKGVYIVGKNHLSSFALQEHPTQSDRYTSPFNPRGDGYQIPGGSSGGSACAVASREWLHFAIGSDATGIIRIPALLNECFGLRPSTGSLSTVGMVSVCPKYDTPGLLGRKLEKFPRFVKEWYDRVEIMTQTTTVTKFLVPIDFFPLTSTTQKDIIESFIQDVQTFEHIKAEYISIADMWSEHGPVDENDINKYLQNATLYSFYYAANKSFRPFRDDFESSHDRKPYITENSDQGERVFEAQHEDMEERIQTFKSWFLQEVMKAPDHNAIVLFPIADMKPNYRDSYPGVPESPVTGLRQTFVSPYLGSPEIVIPIGHSEYQSKITGKKEALPVAVSLMGLLGTDIGWILRLRR